MFSGPFLIHRFATRVTRRVSYGAGTANPSGAPEFTPGL